MSCGSARRWIVCAAFVSMSLSSGCGQPLPKAPEDYEALLGFVFEHMADDDPVVLIEGLEKLNQRLQDGKIQERAARGHTIAGLNEAAVDALDESDRTTQGVEGVGLITASPHVPDEIAATITWDGFGQVVKDDFKVYERTFQVDPDCFATRSCTWLEAESYTESAWGGVVDMVTEYSIQFRWVETAAGWTFLHRFWLEEPAGDPGAITMKGNYYVGVTLPRDDEGAARVHANWFDVDLGSLGLSDDFAFESVVNNMKRDADRVDRWISENPPPPSS